MIKYVTTQQYEPLRAPSKWTREERMLVAQLTNILDDIYRRFGRLRLNDLNSAAREVIAAKAERTDLDGLGTRVDEAELAITPTAIVSTVRSSSEYSTDLAGKASTTDLAGKADASDLTTLASRVDEAELAITPTAIVSTVRSSSEYSTDLAGKASTTDLAGKADVSALASKANVSDLAGKVNKTEIISTINQTAEAVTISASKINLNGAITANNNFKIKTDGSIEAVAGKIGGFDIASDYLTSGGTNPIKLDAGGGEIQVGGLRMYKVGPAGMLECGGNVGISSSTGLMLFVNSEASDIAISDGAVAFGSKPVSFSGSVSLGTVRIPKIVYGTAYANGSSATTINYSSAGFSSAPVVITGYAQTTANTSGDNGVPKVYSKTATSAQMIMSGSSSTSRAIDWVAIGL